MFALPVEFKAAAGYFIVQGIKGFFGLFKVELSGWGSVAAVAFAASLLFFGEGMVGAMAPNVQDAVTASANFVLMILSMLGVHYTYKGLAAK